MNLKKTVYGVYIIEALRADDYAIGENLRDILDLSNMVVLHQWADTKDDLHRHLKDFKRSKLRYLYITCHANSTGIFINSEHISNKELQALTGNIKDVRIFMSACQGANRDLANRLIGKCGGLSLIGTPIDLDFDKAAIFWPSFFHIMKELDEKKMSRKLISSTLKKLVDLFKVPINYYSKIKDEPKYFRRLSIRAGKPSKNTKLIVKL